MCAMTIWTICRQRNSKLIWKHSTADVIDVMKLCFLFEFTHDFLVARDKKKNVFCLWGSLCLAIKRPLLYLFNVCERITTMRTLFTKPYRWEPVSASHRIKFFWLRKKYRRLSRRSPWCIGSNRSVSNENWHLSRLFMRIVEFNFSISISHMDALRLPHLLHCNESYAIQSPATPLNVHTCLIWIKKIWENCEMN